MFIIIIVSMALLFQTVRAQEIRAAQWSTAAADGRDQKRVVRKALLDIPKDDCGPSKLEDSIFLWSQRFRCQQTRSEYEERKTTTSRYLNGLVPKSFIQTVK